MSHVFILIHVLCFAFGISFATYLYVLSRQGQRKYTDLLLGEIFLSIWFLLDLIHIYLRKTLITSGLIDVIRVLSYILISISVFYLARFVIRQMRKSSDFSLSWTSKCIIGSILLSILLWLISYFVPLLRKVPYLCILFVAQCILGFIWVKNPGKVHNRVSANLNILTEREREIVSYVMQGMNNKEIGELLFISPNTVKNHIYNIYKKLEIKNRIDLINIVNRED